MIWTFLYMLTGVVLGAVTGLVPGVHPNVLASVLMSLSVSAPFETSVLMVSAAVTNSFVSFVPSIFLGAPESGTELSVLPGHSLLLEGRGHEALRLTVIGGLLTMVLLLITLPPASGLFPLLYSSIRPHLSVLLSSVLLYSLWADGSLRPLLTIALAGTLGVLALDNLSQPLFPMLTGLFGVSTLLYSLHVEMEVPVQNFMTERMSRGDYLEGSLAGYVSGMSLGILPGLGASQAAFLSQEMLDRDDVRTFLLAIGGVTTSDAVFSLLALWLIGNPRSGVAVAVEGVLEVGRLEVVGLVGAMCVAAVLGAVVALKSSSVLANRISRLDYRKVNLLVIAFLSLLVLSMRGMEGFLLMALSASVGLTAITSGVRRAYLMSALLVPTILFFAPV